MKGKAATYLAAGRHHDAMLSLLRRCNRARASRRGMLRELATSCATIGREDEARAWLALALALDPLDAEAQARPLPRLRPAPTESARKRRRRRPRPSSRNN